VQIDKAGRIAFADYLNQQVDTFDPPVNNAFGEPVTTTPLTGSSAALGLAILASGKDLYVADSGSPGLAEEYTYTAGGSAINTIAVGGQPIGVAVTPSITQEKK
jgi:DNA-binding beta-propeller fold protein YncE